MDETVVEGRVRRPRAVVVPPAVLQAVEKSQLWREDTVFIKPMSGGLNNENWLVTDHKNDKFFLKVPGTGTEFINRAAGNVGTQRAADLGIGASVLEFDPQSGVEITEFLDGYETSTTTTLRIQQRGLQAIKLYRTLHGSQLFEQTNTLFDQIDQHLEQIHEFNIVLPDWVLELIKEYRDVQTRYLASGLNIVPCHNDPMPGNFLFRDDDMKLIDFEFCGNNESSCELGLFITEFFYEDEDAMPLLEEYFGSVGTQDLSRVQASRVIGDIKWGLWGVINSVIRDARFDYWKYGMWKCMRAYTYKTMHDWNQIKHNI